MIEIADPELYARVMEAWKDLMGKLYIEHPRWKELPEHLSILQSEGLLKPCYANPNILQPTTLAYTVRIQDVIKEKRS